MNEKLTSICKYSAREIKVEHLRTGSKRGRKKGESTRGKNNCFARRIFFRPRRKPVCKLAGKKRMAGLALHLLRSSAFSCKYNQQNVFIVFHRKMMK